MPGELDGKVAIVTGGANGLGRATVELFVKEGARVVIADVDVDAGLELAGALGDAAEFMQTDVTDTDQIQAAVDFAAEHFGGLHVMFNNAGVGSALNAFLDDDFTDFERVMGVNLFGVMIGSQRAARHMRANGGGSIINNSSIGGITAGAGVVTYRASKAAVIHFTKSIAADLGRYGIRVNCIAPAHIATDITRYDQGPVLKFMQPLRRQGQPDDVANAVLYLASDRAAQVSGVVLPIDGATTAGPPPNQLKAFAAAMKDSEK
jgi:NAD(P)-dependent dehydrogenase (short-subunit alcohol dehydrogenase family)